MVKRCLLVVPAILFCTVSLALSIPNHISVLGKSIYQVREEFNFLNDPWFPNGNSSYTFLQYVLTNHRDINLLLFLEGSILLFPVILSKTDETIHLTSWGREYDRARKLKDLLIATSEDYSSGLDHLMITSKSHSVREKKYNDSQKIFNKFYAKLKQDFSRASGREMLSEKEIKSLINRANNVGLLGEKTLLKRMVKKNSFQPLRWIILSGQLEDRVAKMEKVIAERDRLESLLKEKIMQERSDSLGDLEFSEKTSLLLSSDLRREHGDSFIELYRELDKLIAEIGAFVL